MGKDTSTSAKVTPRSVSMFSEQWAVLRQVAKDTGLGSVSAAARYVITDWQRLKKQAARDSDKSS